MKVTKFTTDTLQRRSRFLQHQDLPPGPVVYWMSRDQRPDHNWALLTAARLAHATEQPLAVVFTLVPAFLHASPRHFAFMLTGLRETAELLAQKKIAFFLLEGDPEETLPKFVHHQHVSTVITDFSPLKISQHWKQHLVASSPVTIQEVDAHNVVPCWLASPKQEYSAFSLRPKLHKWWPTFLDSFPTMPDTLPWPHSAPPVAWTQLIQKYHGATLPRQSGPSAAAKALTDFTRHSLRGYANHRNDPNAHQQSCLSPYLHFGQLSAQHVAITVLATSASAADQEAFLEELLVRRELSDNYCFYNPHYDTPAGFPSWARATLDKHARDTRPYLYSYAQLETSGTHDDLWNAAQTQMVKQGTMPGYLRMYWAKKILEWTKRVETAQQWAIKLNDTYQLDGRDPNGYTGIAWALGGVHDRPWIERPIFGQIRYMNYAGAQRKFSIPTYVDYVRNL